MSRTVTSPAKPGVFFLDEVRAQLEEIERRITMQRGAKTGPHKQMVRIVHEAKAKLKETRAIIKELNAIIKEKEATIAEKDATIACRDTAIDEKDKLIRDQGKLMKQKDVVISEKDSVIREKDGLMKIKTDSISKKEQEIVAYNTAFTKIQKEVMSLDLPQESNTARQTSTSPKPQATLKTAMYSFGCPRYYA